MIRVLALTLALITAFIFLIMDKDPQEQEPLLNAINQNEPSKVPQSKSHSNATVHEDEFPQAKTTEYHQVYGKKPLPLKKQCSYSEWSDQLDKEEYQRKINNYYAQLKALNDLDAQTLYTIHHFQKQPRQLTTSVDHIIKEGFRGIYRQPFLRCTLFK